MRTDPSRAYSVGAAVEVKHWRGLWYRAEVTEVDTSLSPPWHKVTYDGFAKKYDEWVDEPHLIRNPRGGTKTAMESAKKAHGSTVGVVVKDGEVFYEVEKIIRVRKLGPRPILVKWKGYEGHERERTWEPRRNVPQHVLDEYVTEQTRAAAKRKREAVPYTVRVAGRAPKEVRDRRRDDAEFIEEEEKVARAAVAVMRSARAKTKKPRLLYAHGISEEAYVGLHASDYATPLPSTRARRCDRDGGDGHRDQGRRGGRRQGRGRVSRPQQHNHR